MLNKASNFDHIYDISFSQLNIILNIYYGVCFINTFLGLVMVSGRISTNERPVKIVV